jgi:hypothetical protein
MSNHFKYFPKVSYNFGTEVATTRFTDLSVYVDVFEKVKDLVTRYTYINLLDGERADTASYRLYGNPNYHWTFYYMNDHLQQSGWPLSNQDAFDHTRTFYPHWYIKTKDPLHVSGDHIFTVGQTVKGVLSGSTGTIKRRDLDLGQLIIESTNNFNTNENLELTSGDRSGARVLIYSQGYEYDGTHHVEDANEEWVDIDPTLQSYGSNTIKTFEQNYLDSNLANKRIKIIDPNVIESVVAAFRRVL